MSSNRARRMCGAGTRRLRWHRSGRAFGLRQCNRVGPFRNEADSHILCRFLLSSCCYVAKKPGHSLAQHSCKQQQKVIPLLHNSGRLHQGSDYTCQRLGNTQESSKQYRSAFTGYLNSQSAIHGTVNVSLTSVSSCPGCDIGMQLPRLLRSALRPVPEPCSQTPRWRPRCWAQTP